MRCGSMKESQMPLVHTANLVANSGNIAYGVESIASVEAMASVPDGTKPLPPIKNW